MPIHALTAQGMSLQLLWHASFEVASRGLAASTVAMAAHCQQLLLIVRMGMLLVVKVGKNLIELGFHFLDICVFLFFVIFLLLNLMIAIVSHLFMMIRLFASLFARPCFTISINNDFGFRVRSFKVLMLLGKPLLFSLLLKKLCNVLEFMLTRLSHQLILCIMTAASTAVDVVKATHILQI